MKWSHSRRALSPAARYLLAAGMMAAAIALRIFLDPLLRGRAPYILPFAAVCCAAWLCGRGPALLALAIGAAAAVALFVAPSVAAIELDHLLHLLLFLASALLVTFLVTRAAAAREERAREEQLRGERRFQILVESAPHAILATDREGRIVLFNAKAERMFGYRREEIEGQPVERLVPAGAAEAHRRHREGYAHAPSVRPMGLGMDLTGLRRDGTEIPIEVGLSYAETPAGFRVYAFITDISARKAAQAALRDSEARYREKALELQRLNRQLARYTEDLSRSNEDLEQFAYISSHDLQEPLRVITSFVQLLQRRYRGELDRDADRYIDFIVAATGRMHDLIQGLLEYSRVGRGRGERREPVELQAALEQAQANCLAAIEESGAAITSDPLPCVVADPVQVAQLFQNLLTNAIKFRGAEPPRIHVGARRDGSQWVVSFRDNGVGFEAEQAERVFRMFQRLDHSVPGTGIGLAICKKIVEAHGGKIWAESTPGAGAVFHFTLPAEVSTTPAPEPA
ncbi:MAG: PAS domain S-box protein [Acidobacteria bacterium]|nr:PAS domain S-box protein [Acidobacteriota bacterium]